MHLYETVLVTGSFALFTLSIQEEQADTESQVVLAHFSLLAHRLLL